MIGVNKYKKYYSVVQKKTNIVTFNHIKACAIYDFKLSELLFSLLKHFENYLRATILNNFQNIELNIEKHITQLSNLFGTEGVLEKKYFKKIWNKKILKNKCLLSDFINGSTLGVIIKIYLIMDKGFVVFEDDCFKSNINSIGRLRNDIYHHNVLLDDNFNNKCYIKGIEKKDIKSNVINLFRYLPSSSIKIKYIEYIKELENKYNKNFNYVIKFDKKDIELIMKSKGCNNDY